MPKSILLIGFPRGFTSKTYEFVGRATGLKTAPASAGEVLNPSRWDGPGGEHLEGLRFYDDQPQNFDRVASSLKRFAGAAEPYLIKDVVQPFHVLEYLRRYPDDFQAFFIRRDLADVISRMRARGWSYIHSLDALEARMSRFPVLDSRRIMFDGTYLFRRLRAFGYEVREFAYLGSTFIEHRDAVLDAIEAENAPVEPPPPKAYPPIEVGQIYRFGGGETGVAGRALLASGWVRLGAKTFWSDGQVACLGFTLPPLPQGGSLKLQFVPYAGLDNAVALSLRLEGEAAPVERTGPVQEQRRLVLQLPAAAAPRQAWLEVRPARTVVPARISRLRMLNACAVSPFALKLEEGAAAAEAETEEEE